MGAYRYGDIRVSFTVKEGAPGSEKWHVYYEIDRRVNESTFLFCSPDYYGETLEDVNQRMRNELDSLLDNIKGAFSHAVSDMYWNEGEGAWVPM